MEAFKKKLGIGDGSRNEEYEEKPGVSVNNKGKLLNTWYNMKYGKTIFSLDSSTFFSVADSPAWMLGQCYLRRMRHVLRYSTQVSIFARFFSIMFHVLLQVQSMQEVDCGVTAFHEDFRSKIWFTYRKNFEEFEGTKISSDCGWGCMIRCGQMLLANALIILRLGREWRRNQSILAEDVSNDIMHREIVRLFGDNPKEDISPLSIHGLMKIAKEALKQKPGDWFGPTSTAHILKMAVHKNHANAILHNVKIYVAKDSSVYKGDVYSLCKIDREPRGSPSSDSLSNMDEYSILDPNEVTYPAGTSVEIVSECDNISVENEKTCYQKCPREAFVNGPSWSPVIVLVPLKLGRDQKLNPIYQPCLKSFLACDTCVGIIGGRPKHSLYFVGFQVTSLLLA